MDKTVSVDRFVSWVKNTPHNSLFGDSLVAYRAQVRVLEQLQWYLEGKDDYLIACVDWSWERNPVTG
jgi:hypothetical protein